MKTSQKIENYLAKNRQATGKELSDFLGITDRAVRKQLAKMLEQNKVIKSGIPPRVYYFLSDKKYIAKRISLDKKNSDFIDKHYLYITPLGKKISGLKGFSEWCHKTNQSIEKTAAEYVKTQQRYDKWKNKGVISGLKKIKHSFNEVHLDELYYLDFYSIERFGKTKLGQLLLFAKQSQNQEIISELAAMIQQIIQQIIKDNLIDGVGYVPPTVKREVQLMRVLEKKLALPLRKISIKKIRSKLMVPQKTLSKLQDRVENAAKTIVVEGSEKYKQVLLIDDAVGSGATLNETAKQIKDRGMVRDKIIGLAIVGSYKGFDVISEV